jgi:FAD/FMN-containing dehydrogenase
MPDRADVTPWIAPDAIEWHEADMIATIGAEVPWNKLDSHPSLWLAVDCQGQPNATVGQLIECNSTGPLRLGFGGWRDQLLGCQFRNGKGELITAGGKTVKNVAGYDLTKLMVGQSGVLGRVVAVTMRAYRKPEDALLAEWPPGMEVFNRLIASPCRPQWAVLTAAALHCGYLGNSRSIDYYQQQLPGFAPRKIERHGFAADVRWRWDNWRSSSMRASVPPMQIEEFARRAGLREWAADPAFGIVVDPVAPVAMNGVSAAAAAVGGRAWFWNAERKLIDAQCAPIERAILDKLKAAMDPQLKLQPLP